MAELMNPKEVAVEIVNDVEDHMPNILERSTHYTDGDDLNTAEMEGKVMYRIQDAKISTYNIHMELQGIDFPLDDASDFSNEAKFQQLLDWLRRYHPDV